MNQEVRFFLSRESKRKIYASTVLSVLAVLTIGQKNAGFLGVFVLLPLGIWLGWSAYVIVARPYSRLAQAICVLIWAIAIVLIVGAHLVRHEIVRGDADLLVREVRRHIVDYGRCPGQLEDLGFKREELRECQKFCV